MMETSKENRIFWALRIASAMCFMGHGAFGIITKPIWCNYFAVFGFDKAHAYQLMPVLGAVDIVLGLILLVYPIRAAALWLVIWGIVTAALRPLAHEPFAEFIERAGNYGAPFGLLVITGCLSGGFKGLFTRLKVQTMFDDQTIRRLTLLLRIVVFLLLAGHGWLNLVEKKGLLGQYSSLGFADPVTVAKAVGIFEIVSAFAVLIRPSRPMIAGLIVWKIGSEFFYPHYEFFEWVERGGSYGCLLALWFALEIRVVRQVRHKFASASS